jgi:type II secretory ATPase GspE/PulE/Tfp pilus assembly ATPase PilB-like protein
MGVDMGIPLDLQRTLQIKPLGLHEGVMRVAPLLPLTPSELNGLSMLLGGTPVLEHPIDRSEVLQHLRSIAGNLFAMDVLHDFSAVFSVTLIEAVQANASDLHIRCMANTDISSMRRRIHGHLQAPLQMDSAVARRFITWVKQRAGLDSSEHVQPQEGRFTLAGDGVNVEFRVSCAGQTDGEVMVIRILDPRNTRSLDALISEPGLAECFRKLVRIESKQGGLVLISGPTGAGKTTTLAALISALPLHRLKVVAIEDPVEIRTAGVDHLEVNAAQGLDFAHLLRAVMRQDPDVIIIGEIRDSETAEIALRAVETGHWVMASVHAGSVLETVYRLTSLLPEGYRELGRMTLQSRLHAVINQQLLARDGGRELRIEALFVDALEHLIPWYAPGADPAKFPSCSYFARP